ncbi:MAG: methylenetetrahydrofolate reductase [Chloroflexi bacterium]|nr:MAG: methylenetetrahydrofolate reductase [Chloroflexota bacterium]TME45686.1 MAG: methylenetetrahydrofolate reductase [Chloroflexota bacterium]
MVVMRVPRRVGRGVSGISRLAELLRSGQFVVTAELASSDSADPDAVGRNGDQLRGVADAINCTDNTGAHVHLSSMAAAHLLAERGIEPIMQLTVRDRNRLALQADLLGAAALGIRNIVVMSGDDVTAGDHPEARRIYDIDSMQLIEVAAGMRDRGVYLSGRKLEKAPAFFIGAVENPFAPPLEFRPLRLQKKVRAGADFVQTQLVFDLPIFTRFMSMAADLGLFEQVFIIPSIGIPRSARGARFMKEKVPGLHVPDALIERMEKTPPARQAEEGIRIAVELVNDVRQIHGVAGVHLIGIKWEEGVTRVAEAAGLLPRPTLSPLATVGGRR